MSLRALAVAMLAALTAPSGVLAFCQPKTEYCVPPIDCGERPQVPCFEKPPPDELQNIDRIVKLTIEQLQADHAARCRAGAQLRRDAHAKHHGCVRGSFEVMTGKIPVRHRVGVFKQQMTYPAWIMQPQAFSCVLPRSRAFRISGTCPRRVSPWFGSLRHVHAQTHAQVGGPRTEPEEVGDRVRGLYSRGK